MADKKTAAKKPAAKKPPANKKVQDSGGACVVCHRFIPAEKRPAMYCGAKKGCISKTIAPA